MFNRAYVSAIVPWVHAHKHSMVPIYLSIYISPGRIGPRVLLDMKEFLAPREVVDSAMIKSGRSGSWSIQTTRLRRTQHSRRTSPANESFPKRLPSNTVGFTLVIEILFLCAPKNWFDSHSLSLNPLDE